MKPPRRAGPSRSVLPPRRTAVSRADLAWLLYALPVGEAAGGAALLGFAREDEEVPPPPKPPPAPRPPPPRGPASGVRPPLRAVHFAVIGHEQLPPESEEDAETRPGEVAAEHSDEVFATLQPEPGAVVPAALALSRPARLASFLRCTLRTPGRGREVDVERLLVRLARVSLPRRLPLRERLHWSDEAALIVDLSPAVWPLREDLIDLAEQACSASAGRLPVYARQPGSGWLRRTGGRRGEWLPVDEAALFASRHWLLAGDPGHSPADCAAGREWQQRCRRHLARGGTLTLLGGAAAAGWLRRLPRRCRLAGWEYGRPLCARRPGAAAAAGGEVVSERLLAALSLAVVVEPPLLRAIRVALGLPLADELAAWNHADSESCVLGLQLRHERLAAHRRRLAGEPLADRQRVAALIAGHHSGHYRAIRSEEAALAADLAGVDAAQARADWARAVRTLQRAPQGEAARELAAYLGRAGGRAHESLWQALPAFADAYVIARRAELRAGEAVPRGLPGRSLERWLALPGETVVRRRWSLRLCGPALVAGAGAPQAGEFVLAEGEAAAGVAVETARGARHWHLLPPSDAERVRLAALRSRGGPWVVASARERIVVAEVPRPSWALAWGRDRQGLFALAPSLAGDPLRLYWSADGEAPAVWPPPARGFRSPGQQLGRGVRIGADLEYGLWLDVEIAGVVARFRWIEPGEFSMGSPETEDGRDDDEGPRHRVRLTAGFWLADTACTQELWRAVAGSNPSHFSGNPQNPVETVSWDDVQAFLRRVEGLLPGVRAELPSEAEWEYACRSGSESAYSWGDEPTPERAHYGAHGTVPVKSFAPNAWGLYEMHGNVWEWCADGQRRYSDEAVDDPRGPEAAGALRVVRGGSWDEGAGGLRSASRIQWPRGARLVDRGFRLSLRSTAAERLAQGRGRTG